MSPDGKVEEEVGGTLISGRVFVTESRLPRSGFGLFAGRTFAAGEVITSYEGPIIHRSEVDGGLLEDTSYVLRIPDSGGALIDGKPYADAIRANRGRGHSRVAPPSCPSDATCLC